MMKLTMQLSRVQISYELFHQPWLAVIASTSAQPVDSQFHQYNNHVRSTTVMTVRYIYI